MTKGKRAGDTPIGVDVLEGKFYYTLKCSDIYLAVRKFQLCMLHIILLMKHHAR